MYLYIYSQILKQRCYIFMYMYMSMYVCVYMLFANPQAEMLAFKDLMLSTISANICFKKVVG